MNNQYAAIRTSAKRASIFPAECKVYRSSIMDEYLEYVEKELIVYKRAYQLAERDSCFYPAPDYLEAARKEQ